MGFITQIVNKFLPVKIMGSDSISSGIIVDKKLTTGSNLFDKNAPRNSGYFVSFTNGGLQANASYDATDYIPISPNSGYKFSIDNHFAIYDSNKVVVELHQMGTGYQTFYTPSNAAYIRSSINLGNTNIDAYSIYKLSLVRLPDIPCREVLLVGKKANTGSIFVGDISVTPKNYGVELSANESVSIPVSNSNLVYIVSSVTGEGISYVITI